MRYLMFICGDGVPASDPEEEFAGAALTAYVEDTASARVFGHPLLGPETATTLRPRGGETLLSDGPFVETKEHIVGFDVLDCADRDEAVRLAAAHPMAWFHRVEVRPFARYGGDDEWTAEVVQRLRDDPSAGTRRYLMLIVGGGTDSAGGGGEADTAGELVASWIEENRRSGARIVGQLLAGPQEAVTVRTRGPHTLVSDGPFAEGREFVAGFDVVECADLDEAIAIAERHPVARREAIEIRPWTMTPRGPASDPPAPALSRVSA